MEMEKEIEKADSLIRSGRPSEAVLILKKVAQRWPNEPYPHYLLGIARMKCGRFFLAKKATERAGELAPQNVENLRSLGWIKVMLGQLEEGRKNLRESISLDLTNPLAYLDLAMSYFQNYQFEEGDEWLARAKALNPRDDFILRNCQIAEEIKKQAGNYSKADRDELKKEKLNQEKQKFFRLSVLQRHIEGKPLNADEAEEVTEELRLNGVSEKDIIIERRTESPKKNKKKIWNVVFGRKGASAFPVGQGEDGDFYDDCPVCQLLKRAKEQGREPTEAELKEAFQKSKEHGAIVGGKRFEKK